MEEKRKEIEEVVRKLVNKLDLNLDEERIQSFVERLSKMKDTKQVIDSLALRVDSYIKLSNRTDIFEECIDELLRFGGDTYKNKEEIKNQLQRNQELNYEPGNLSVEDNHKLILDTIKEVCDKLNALGVDYYVVGALSAFIGTKTPLFRYHGDIDFMIEEKDIEKVRKALEGTDYIFEDNRLNNKKRLEEGVGHTQGEHEVIANHKDNEFHLGFFLFRREKDKSITVREYFMQQNEHGESVPMVLERSYPPELAALEYTSHQTEFAGTRFKTATPEGIYAKKIYTRHPKDILDIKALESKIDNSKLAEMEEWTTKLKIVEPDERELLDAQNEESNFLQRLLTKVWRKISRINRIWHKKEKLLPEDVTVSDDARKKFEDGLSYGGEHKFSPTIDGIEFGNETKDLQANQKAKEPTDD